MELGILILLAVAAGALGWFWLDGVGSGKRLMQHRPWGARGPLPGEEASKLEDKKDDSRPGEK